MERNYGKPSELIHPKHKGKAWCLKNAQYFHGNYSRNGFGYRDRTAISERRAYVTATQSVQRYKEKIKCDETNKENGNVPIDYTPLPLLNKYSQIVVDMILQQTGTVDINAVDPLSVNQKEEAKNRIKTNAILQEQLKIIEALSGMQAMDKEIAETPTAPEELELYMQENTKISAERDLTDVCALVKERSEYKKQLYKYAKSLVDDGIAAHMVKINEAGFLVKEGIDSRFLLAPYSDHADFENLEYVGYMKFVENTKVLAHLQKNEKLNFEDAKEVLVKCSDYVSERDRFRYNEEYYNQSNGVGGKTAVACIYWKSIDRKVKGYKQDENGNRRVVDIDEDKEALDMAELEVDSMYDKVLEDTMENVYYSEWIVGTDYQMNYGLMYNQPRDAMFPELTRLPIRVEAPILNEGIFQSFISLVMPIYDRIMEAYLKLQDNIARSIPKGLALDVKQLRAVVMNGETTLTVAEIIKYFYKTGNLLFEGSGAGTGLPIIELENGIGQSVIILNNLMMQWHAMLKEMSGINEAVDGTSPNSEMGIGVMKQMVANTNSALSAYRHAIERYEITTVQDIVDLAPMAAKANPKQFFVSLGERTTEFIKDLKEPRSYGFAFTRNLTNKEWQEFLGLAEKAIGASPEAGGITTSDYLRIRQMENSKQAAAVLNMLIKKNQREYQKMQAESIQATAQAQAQSAQAASQLKIQEAQALAQIDLQTETAKHKMKIELENIKGQIALAKAKLDNATREEIAMMDADVRLSSAEQENDGWVESAQVAADGAMEKTIADNETRILIAEMNNRAKEKVASLKPKPVGASK